MDPQTQYGMSLSDVSSIRNFTQSLVNDTQKYTNYLFSKMGYPQWLIGYAAQVWSAVQPYKPIMNHRSFVCGMLHYEDAPYNECKANGTTITTFN